MMDFSELETSSGKPFILRMMLAPVFGTALLAAAIFCFVGRSTLSEWRPKGPANNGD
jgi:hypothetical protein